MPLGPTEFPDSAIHRMCVRCHQWCWPEEGQDYVLPRVSPLASAATAAGIERESHFMCFACRRKRIVLRIWIIAVLAVLVGLAIVFVWFRANSRRALVRFVTASGRSFGYDFTHVLRHFQRRLDALVSRTPSHPFTVEQLGGRRFEVDHARAMVARDGVAVCIAPGGFPIWFDHEGVASIVGGTANAA